MASLDKVYVWSLTALVVGMAGCDRPGTAPTAPASGIVTFNGAPANDVRVIFTPASGRPAIGQTDAEGRFVLTTFQRDDGAVPGKHSVTISDRQRDWIQEMNDGPSKTKTPPRFPEKYQRANMSPWSYEVKAGEENFFKLQMTDSAAPAK